MNIVATIIEHDDKSLELDWVEMDQKKSIQLMTYLEDYVPGSLRGDIDDIIADLSRAFHREP